MCKRRNLCYALNIGISIQTILRVFNVNMVPKKKKKSLYRNVRKLQTYVDACVLLAEVLDEAGYDPVYKVLDKLGLPRSFPDFTTVSYTNGSLFNVARTLALAQRYLSADILVQLSLEPDPVADRASLFVMSLMS